MDLDEIGGVIERAEVLVVRFQVVQRRILVDFRTSADAGPLARAVAPASSAEERFRSLKALRPSLPLPERIMSFLWPRSVGAMADAGVLDRIRDRLVRIDAEVGGELDRAFGELLGEEHATLVAAIRGGEGFQTLWEREPS
ncbi:MAG: hypothetical protein OXI03_04515 [Chloroflexota bacterium]|nr:hypothetical protein [Chloroflexota bacterium]